MELLLTCTYAFIFIGIIYKFSFFSIAGLSKKGLSVIFLIKVLAGFSLYLVYTYYYTDRSSADTFKYFDDSKVLYDALWTHPKDFFQILFGLNEHSEYLQSNYFSHMHFWYNAYRNEGFIDSRIIIRLNAVVRIFSMGYFNVHNVFFNFISFSGLVALYKGFSWFRVNAKLLITGVFFIPSVLFWGSGVLKEAILLFGTGFLFLGFIRLNHNKIKLKCLLFFASGYFLLLYVKPYVLLSITPALLAYLWVNKTNNRYILLKYLSLLFLGFILLAGGSIIGKKYDVMQVIADKQNDFVKMAEGGVYLSDGDTVLYYPDDKRNELEQLDGTHFRVKNDTTGISYIAIFNGPRSGSLIEMNELEPNPNSFLKAAPMALFIAFFRPFLFESFSPFMLLAGLENFVFIILLAGIAIFYKRPEQNHLNLIYFCLMFTFILYLFIGITTPVMGAIVRYKIPALPFIFITLALLIDGKKLTKRFPFLKKLI